MSERHLILAISGASGAVYGLRLGAELLRAGYDLSLLISKAGFTVLQQECDLVWGGSQEEVARSVEEYFNVPAPRLSFYAEDDLLAPIASGSRAPEAMVIAPCSMGSLGRIAAGLSGTLIERCADVMLKEGRTLLLMPRETPLSAIHLENMLKLARLGVKIVPAMPAFYHKPVTVADQVDFVVGKVLDQLGVKHRLYLRWGTDEKL